MNTTNNRPPFNNNIALEEVIIQHDEKRVNNNDCYIPEVPSRHGLDLRLDQIQEDLEHEGFDPSQNFGFRLEHFLMLPLFFCTKKPEGQTEEQKPKWLYRYFSPIHISYIIFCGFFFGTIFFILELFNPKTNVSYIDALVMSFANVCLCGFVTHPIQDITIPSQVCLFFALVSGGATLTLIPILLIKTFRARERMLKLRSEAVNATLSHNNQSNLQRFLMNIKDIFIPNDDPFPYSDIEYSALMWLNFITTTMVIVINGIGFIILGSVFAGVYNQEKYLHGKHPYWLGLYIAVSAFNNCGSTLLDEGLSNFVNDWSICLTVGILIMLGNVLLPLTLRYIIVIFYKFSSKRKVVFKYILEKHHHLSPYLFPGLQTTVYGIVTLLLLVVGIIITMANDWNSTSMTDKSIATRILISIFHPISSRAGGFNSIDLFTLSFPTLAFYIFMMYTKPQMACSLRENAYQIVDMVRYLNEEKSVLSYAHKNETTIKNETPTISTEINPTEENVIVVKLQKKKSASDEALERLEEEEKQAFGYSLPRVNTSHTLTSQTYSPSLASEAPKPNRSQPDTQKTKIFKASSRVGKFSVKFFSDLWFYITTLLSSSGAWLFVMVLIISFAENGLMKEDPASFSIFYVLFEVISSYATSGLSVGKHGSTMAYCAFWTGFSKIILCIVLIMGRHRGFYGTLLDLEEGGYDQEFKEVSDILERRARLKKFKKEGGRKSWSVRFPNNSQLL